MRKHDGSTLRGLTGVALFTLIACGGAVNLGKDMGVDGGTSGSGGTTGTVDPVAACAATCAHIASECPGIDQSQCPSNCVDLFVKNPGCVGQASTFVTCVAQAPVECSADHVIENGCANEQSAFTACTDVATGTSGDTPASSPGTITTTSGATTGGTGGYGSSVTTATGYGGYATSTVTATGSGDNWSSGSVGVGGAGGFGGVGSTGVGGAGGGGPAICQATEMGPVAVPDVDTLRQLVLGRWLGCGDSIFGTYDEVGVELVDDGNWYKLYTGADGSLQRGQGFDHTGTWTVVDNTGFQLRMEIFGGGGVYTFPVFATTPRKMRLNNSGHVVDYVHDPQ